MSTTLVIIIVALLVFAVLLGVLRQKSRRG